jgi:cystathionine beta-lyase
MKSKTPGVNTICTHVGEIKDQQFKGATSPLYMSTSYAYENVDIKRYPRYFNTPNQEGLSKKVAMLEHCDAALIFGSGMAAISTALLSFLEQGDHIVIQQSIYGGAFNFMVEELPKFGIEFDFTEGFSEEDFRKKVKGNTKVIYVETPSNPLMKITDLEMIAQIAEEYNLVSMIDNTFATPVNQTPADYGIDIMIHSATKYFGGHSDFCAGAIAGNQMNIDRIWNTAKNFGGSLSDYTVWLLERSMKTLALRVKKQSRNARKIAKWLEKESDIKKVYYPGLKSNPDYKLAKNQMKRYSGMLSFELADHIDTNSFLESLQLIKPSMSLAGVESTIIAPSKASHFLLDKEERKKQGISDNLLRLSLGIEESNDIKDDISQAIIKGKNK